MNYDLPSEITVTKEGPVRVVTMNRPENLNAVNPGLHLGITRVWRQLAMDDEARAVVLTGSGRAFCAGGDIGTMETDLSDPVHRRRQMVLARELVQDMTSFPMPIVGAVNGPAIGLGCSIALFCDIVYMAESAWLSDPHVSAVGLVCGDGGAAIWPLLTSLSRAKEYLMTGDRIPAEAAERYGLANRVVADEELVGEALALAQRLASYSRFSIEATKRALNMHLERAFVGILDYAMSMEDAAMDTAEHKERVAAFLRRARA
jgi:enoyl-CoA hydratase